MRLEESHFNFLVNCALDVGDKDFFMEITEKQKNSAFEQPVDKSDIITELDSLNIQCNDSFIREINSIHKSMKRMPGYTSDILAELIISAFDMTEERRLAMTKLMFDDIDKEILRHVEETKKGSLNRMKIPMERMQAIRRRLNKGEIPIDVFAQKYMRALEEGHSSDLLKNVLKGGKKNGLSPNIVSDETDGEKTEGQ